MHETFYSLNEDKQSRILNAAMQVFSKYPYSKASIDDIAALAGISKGALFYHFKNKKDLYCFLYEYCCRKIYEKLNEFHVFEERDFFSQNMRAVEARVCAMINYPYIIEFGLRAYYETEKAVENDIKFINKNILEGIFAHFNKNIDTSKFRNTEDVKKAVKMLVWLSEGFLKERREAGTLDLKEIQTEFNEYLQILKRGFSYGEN